MMTRRRRLWCVLALADNRVPFVLNAVGNGEEFQYPIFPTRSEARRWAKRTVTWRTQVVRCVVMFRAQKAGR